MMVKQMSNANTVPSETAGLSPMALDNEVLQTLPNRALEQMVRRAMPKARRPPRRCRSTTATSSLACRYRRRSPASRAAFRIS